jgi:F-type H+-transporting ATPase subunit b
MELVTPGLGLVFWMLVSFLILLFILKKYAWKPVLEMLKEREKTIDDALKSAERAKEETYQMQLANEQMLQQARNERVEMLKEARRMQEQIISEARTEAASEARRIIEAANETLRKERFAAINAMKNQIALLSIDIAGKIIHRELSGNKEHQEYISKLLEEVKLN